MGNVRGVTAASKVGRVDSGYIRVSREDADDPRSLEDQQRGQTDAIRRMAERDGSTDLVILSDWDRSADPAKEHRRTGFAELIRRIEAGDIGTVYARSLDRLYRSIKTFVRLTDACKAQGTRIVTEREGVLGGSSPMAQAFAEMTAVFAGMELATAKARASAGVTRRRASIEEHEHDCPGPRVCGVWSNHSLGHEPYGWRDGENSDDVIEAFRETGSFLGAARLLTARGVLSRRNFLTPNGVSMGWNAATVAGIVRRELPDVPRASQRGVRVTGTRRLSRLLICPHDETFLTTSPRANGRTMYVCRIGHHGTPDAGHHPRPYSISESALMEWTREQAGYVMRLSVSTPPDEGEIHSEISDLLAKRDRYALLFAEGDLPEAVWRVKRDDLDHRIEALRGSVRTFLAIANGVPWGASPAQVNADLRDICAGIRLGYVGKGRGRRLLPIGAIWKVEPIIEILDEDGSSDIRHPDAVPVDGGWYLPASAADQKVTAR
jgi:DNA invertase Pin-like site-specific DNA recombinase